MKKKPVSAVLYILLVYAISINTRFLKFLQVTKSRNLMMPKFDYIKYQPTHRMCDDSRRIMNGYIINKSIVKYWYYYTIVLYHKIPIVTAIVYK